MTISMVIAMRRYYIARITQWRRFRAFIKATKHCHWASTCSNSGSGQSVIAMLLFGLMFEVRWLDFVGRWQLLHMGVTYQSDGKDLVDGVEYLYWGAKLVN
jgi:hypothetical protein